MPPNSSSWEASSFLPAFFFAGALRRRTSDWLPVLRGTHLQNKQARFPIAPNRTTGN